MTPMEGCLYLGVHNTFMVPCGWEVDRRQYNKSFLTLREVGWECYAAGKNPQVVEPLIADAKDFKNIGRVVYDDFQRGEEYKEIPLGTMVAIVSALIYWVSPIDIIPDVIPGLGQVDDALVVAVCLAMVKSDLDDYKKWLEKNQ